MRAVTRGMASHEYRKQKAALWCRAFPYSSFVSLFASTTYVHMRRPQAAACCARTGRRPRMNAAIAQSQTRMIVRWFYVRRSYEQKCYVVLWCVVLCSVVLYRIVLCCAVQCCVVFCFVRLITNLLVRAVRRPRVRRPLEPLHAL